MRDQGDIQKVSSRIHHIDAMRAFAILMMLQGHFVYSMLSYDYQDPENGWFWAWRFCRGFTAPIFFTVTGIVLTYLLLKKDDIQYRLQRIRKGIRRGFYLIFWGYLLRLSLWSLLSGHINHSFWCLDVLHCIGTAMIVLLSIYWLLLTKPIIYFQVIIGLLGLIIFMTEPLVAQIDTNQVPNFIAPFINRSFGSVFTPLPWAGYTLLGGLLGTIYIRAYQSTLGRRMIIGGLFLAVGSLLTFYSSSTLMDLYHWGICPLCKEVAYNNYLLLQTGKLGKSIFSDSKYEKSFVKKI